MIISQVKPSFPLISNSFKLAKNEQTECSPYIKRNSSFHARSMANQVSAMIARPGFRFKLQSAQSMNMSSSSDALSSKSANST